MLLSPVLTRKLGYLAEFAADIGTVVIDVALVVLAEKRAPVRHHHSNESDVVVRHGHHPPVHLYRPHYLVHYPVPEPFKLAVGERDVVTASAVASRCLAFHFFLLSF